MTTLYHGSPVDCGDTLTAQFADAKANFIFDGLFCTDTYDDTYGVRPMGDLAAIYSVDIDEDEILNDNEMMAFYYGEKWQNLEDAIKKITGITPDDERFERLVEGVCWEEIDIWHNREEEEFWGKVTRETEIAYISWGIQNLRINLARELGYKAVTMTDEGASYAVVPGVVLKKIA